MKCQKYTEEVFDSPLSLVHGWDELGALLKIKTKYLSWVGGKDENGNLRRNHMQHLVKVKGRSTYKSDTTLARIQTALNIPFDQIQDSFPHEHLLAYRKGVNYKKELQKYHGRKYMVHCDIKGYFDNISMRKIVKTLCALGSMSEAGAKLIARYCIVRRRQSDHWVHTLQQGSPCSALLSNLVGYALYDRDILAWVARKQKEYPRASLEYVRYCDNLVLFVDGDAPLELIKEYRQYVHVVMSRSGFQTHKWSVTPKNHPFRNQRFLGVVLNVKARVDLERFQRIRAALFNACRTSVTEAANTYFSLYPFRAAEFPTENVGEDRAVFAVTQHARDEQFLSIMRGHLAYIDSVSKEQGILLKKLFQACVFLRENPQGVSQRLSEPVFLALKTYNRKVESVEVFLERLSSACSRPRNSSESLTPEDTGHWESVF